MPQAIRPKPTLVRLHLLGRFCMESAGRALALPTRKLESLLAYIALHPEPIPREKLAALIWCDSPKDQARNSLRNALPVLRKCLGTDILFVERATVQIAPQVRVDAREFKTQADAFLAAASPHLDDFHPSLYTGDLLCDFYDEWILPEREHYRRLYIETLLKLAQLARAASEYPRAIELAGLVLQNDPANEHAHQHLMFAHMATGNRDAALAQYETCRRVLQTELDVEPMPETTALYEWICRSAPQETGLAARLTNLPIPVSNFIGRRRETAQVKSALASQRLLTLTGAGGSGKTRLAIQVATDLIDRFSDGVWWVELGPLTKGALVPDVVAKTLGVREMTNEPIGDTLAYWIGTRQMLLVLDNCEHLIAICAQLSEKLLESCPRLTILVTSREGLGIYGETTYLVPLLSVPAHNDEFSSLEQCEAVRLFVERARGVRSNFALTEKNAPFVAQICRRLDGIPLAIELAAARVAAMSVQEITARLDDRFNLLTTGSPTALPRQQTLRALIDWSYDLLSSAEKILFRRLAVFHGGAALQAIEQVCSGEGLPVEQVLDLLTRLIDRSLLQMEEANGVVLYRMLDTIHHYAGDKLAAAGETTRLNDRHLDYYLGLAQMAESGLRGAEQSYWCNLLDQKHNNLRAALEWSRRVEKDDGGGTTLQLASALAVFWALRGHWSEGRTWLSRAQGHGAVTRARAKALLGLAELVARQDGPAAAQPVYASSLALYRALGDKWGIALAAAYMLFAEEDPARARSLFDDSLAISQELNDTWLTANAYHRRGISTFRLEGVAVARSLMEQGLVYARPTGDRWLISSLLINLGEALRGQGDYAHAGPLYEEGLAILQELGDKCDSAIALHNLGYIALSQHDDARAAAFFIESMNMHREAGNRRGIAECLVGLGNVAAARKQYVRATRLWASGDNFLEAMKLKKEPTEQVECDRYMTAVLAEISEAAFKTAWQAGRSMTPEQAIELALKEGE